MSAYRDRFCSALATKLWSQHFAEECIKDVEKCLEEEISPFEGKFDTLLAETIAIYTGSAIGTAQKAVKYARKRARINEVVVDNALTIMSLYVETARKVGYSAAEINEMEFDCTKITVAPSIKERIFAWLAARGAVDSMGGSLWVCYGPKVDENLEKDHVCIQDEFFIFRR